MEDPVQVLVRQLLGWIVGQRRSPNQVVSALLASGHDLPADDLQLAFLEVALRLEEIYDAVCRDEWNDWQRADYWNRVSQKGQSGRGGSAELLMLKTELYRVIALIATDVIVLRRQNIDPVTGNDLLQLWLDRQSEYF